MHMGMLGVMVNDSNPLQVGTNILFRLLQNLACEPFQVYAITEFGREDKFPEPLVAGSLPVSELGRNINSCPELSKPTAFKFSSNVALSRAT
jgi:hypothetical protein